MHRYERPRSPRGRRLPLIPAQVRRLPPRLRLPPRRRHRRARRRHRSSSPVAHDGLLPRARYHCSRSDRGHALAGDACAAVERLDAIDRACSRFRSDSELARVNSARGARVAVGPYCSRPSVSHSRARVQWWTGRSHSRRGPRAAGYDATFRIVAARDGARFRARFVAVPGWQSVDLDERAATVRVPAGVELDLGATAKALACDRAATRRSGRRFCSCRARRRHRRCGHFACRRLVCPDQRRSRGVARFRRADSGAYRRRSCDLFDHRAAVAERPDRTASPC